MVSYLDQGGVQHLVDKLLDRMYPVNSIYISTNSTSPASLYGGSWERYGTGRVLVSADDSDTDFTAGKTGGNKSNTHRHWMPLGREGTTSDPTTNTALTMLNGDTMQKIGLGRRVKDKSNTSAEHLWHSWFLKAGENNTTGYVENTTYDETIDIMNPYVAVYIWRRTA